jgi:protein ImuA
MHAGPYDIVLNTLRSELARLERSDRACRRAASLPFGLGEVDTVLPGGGLVRGALHEAWGAGPQVEHGTAAALLAAGLLARASGQVVWVLQQRDLYPPALAAIGLTPERMLFVHARTPKTVLLAMEEALRHPGLAGVVGELSGTLSLTASRRLQLAAGQSGVTAFLLRRSRRFDDPVLDQPSAAVTRWRVASVPSAPPLPHAPDTPGLGPPRWRVDLLRCRGGEPQSWILEAFDAPDRCRLAPDLGDRQAPPERRPAAA